MIVAGEILVCRWAPWWRGLGAFLGMRDLPFDYPTSDPQRRGDHSQVDCESRDKRELIPRPDINLVSCFLSLINTRLQPLFWRIAPSDEYTSK